MGTPMKPAGRRDEIRLYLASELRRKYEAGLEVPGTEWLRGWALALTEKAEGVAKTEEQVRGIKRATKSATPTPKDSP